MQQFAHHCLVIVAEAATSHVTDTPLQEKTRPGVDAVLQDDAIVKII